MFLSENIFIFVALEKYKTMSTITKKVEKPKITAYQRKKLAEELGREANRNMSYRFMFEFLKKELANKK